MKILHTLRYAITYGRYAASRNSAAKGSAQRTCLSPCSVRRTKRMEACAECDLETEYTLLDELKVVNGIRVDVVAEKASANQPGAPPWPSHLHATLRATFNGLV